MFSLLKSSFNNIWKGEAHKPRISSGDEISEEGFILVPNRKRVLKATNHNTLQINNDEPRIKKDSECSSVIGESPTIEAEQNTKNIEVELSPCLDISITEDLGDVALDGVPFLPSPQLLQVHDLLRDIPPVCPSLPHVSFDFTLERTVLDR